MYDVVKDSEWCGQNGTRDNINPHLVQHMISASLKCVAHRVQIQQLVEHLVGMSNAYLQRVPANLSGTVCKTSAFSTALLQAS